MTESDVFYIEKRTAKCRLWRNEIGCNARLHPLAYELQTAEGMAAILQGDFNPPTLLTMRLENGKDHFQNGPSGSLRAECFPIFDDGSNEITSRGDVSPDEGANVRDGFGLVDSGGGDGNPFFCFRSGLEGASRKIPGKRFCIPAKIDDSFGADELNSEPGFFASAIHDRVEKDRNSFVCFKTGMDFISGEGADRLRSLLYVACNDGTPVLQDGCRAGEGIADEIMAEVE